MAREGEVPKSAGMTIRVFWPNPLPGTYTGNPLNLISSVFQVSYLEKLDPIYHELAFIDEKGKRHQFVGLAYWIEEIMAEAGGVDVSV